MLIDTHCHLNLMAKDSFNTPLKPEHFILIEKIIHQAKQVGINKIITVGTSLIESYNCTEIAQRFDGVYASVGIHPHDLTAGWKTDFDSIKELVSHKDQYKIVAIGECGIDKHHPKYNLQQQQDGFRAHIELAIALDLPLIIHTRDCAIEMQDFLNEFGHKTRGVFHCFSGDLAFAQILIQKGFYIGIDGPVTYPKNTQLQSIVKAIQLRNILLETDAPYLPPQIIRGKQNAPCYLKEIAHYMTTLRNESFEHISQQTTQNAINLFNLI